VHDRVGFTQPYATDSHADRLAVVETNLASIAANGVEQDGERFITHGDTLRLLGALLGLSEGGAAHHVRRARAAGRLRTIRIHPRARLYASTDVLALLRNA
jgi:hypothetical protein